MARFDQEQALAVVAIQQLVNDWAFDLDVNNGHNVVDLVTEECTYFFGGVPHHGRAAVGKFYADRLARLSATPEGVPTQRHVNSTLRVAFTGEGAASITFSLLYFTTAGVAPGASAADPAAVADVRMECRRDPDGHWRIARFDSNQVLKR